MSTKTPEGKIQSDIIKYLKQHKIWHVRYNANITYGLPDIIAIYDGYFIGIEVKAPKGRATELQIKMKESIEQAGGYHVFATSVEDVYQIIRKIEKLKDNENTTERISKPNTKGT